MKLTKKAATLLLAASLAVSVCAMPVFAADTAHAGENVSGTTPTNTTTTVKYEVTEGYKWAIPATIDFGKDAGLNATRTVDANQVKDTGSYKVADTNVRGESGNVYVSDCRLKPGTKLTISISSTTTMYNATDGFYVKRPIRVPSPVTPPKCLTQFIRAQRLTPQRRLRKINLITAARF